MTIQNRTISGTFRNAISVLFLITTGLILSGCSGESGGSERDMDTQLIPAVEAVQARYGALPLTERLTGIVKAKNQVEIYPQINAMIVAVEVRNGDLVEQGQPLVRLRDKEFLEQLRQARASYRIAVAQAKQAEAQLNEIQAELQRTETLAEKELTSTSELEAVRSQAISAEASVELANARVEQAEATVDEREEALSQTVIRAPTAGTIGNRNAEVGMLVSSNAQLFTLGQLDSVRVEVVLTDRMLNYLEEGQRTEIQAGSGVSGGLTAPLSRISPFLHPVSHSTNAEIDLANSDNRLKPGMFVPVDVYYGESAQATLVPLSALYENPMTGGTGVYLSREMSGRETADGMSADSDGAIALTEPLPFEFVPVEVIARGRMQAGIRGIEQESWVITLGQDLLGGEPGQARVRAVNWGWVEQLQSLQRQDLMEEIIQRRQARQDSAAQTNEP